MNVQVVERLRFTTGEMRTLGGEPSGLAILTSKIYDNNWCEAKQKKQL